VWPTHFVTATLPSMFRRRSRLGESRGGPMCVVTAGRGRQVGPLAAMFAFCCLFGALPIFQANQLTRAIRDILLTPAGIPQAPINLGPTTIANTDLYTGVIITFITAIVVIGGIRRIGNWAGSMVPLMVVIYF